MRRREHHACHSFRSLPPPAPLSPPGSVRFGSSGAMVGRRHRLLGGGGSPVIEYASVIDRYRAPRRCRASPPPRGASACSEPSETQGWWMVGTRIDGMVLVATHLSLVATHLSLVTTHLSLVATPRARRDTPLLSLVATSLSRRDRHTSLSSRHDTRLSRRDTPLVLDVRATDNSSIGIGDARLIILK